MANLGRLLAWIGPILALLIAGLAAAYFLLRRRILRHVSEELGREALLLATGARVGASDSSANGTRSPARVGVLMLLSNGLYFHSWMGSSEVFVPGPSISWIGVSEAPGAPRSERHRILVRFLNASGKEDGITIRLLYPEEWVAAIKTHLITRAN
jgi:hypothetical protein